MFMNNSSYEAIPPEWRALVDEELLFGERICAALNFDLDTRLCFKKGLLVITDRRVLAREAEQSVWHEWLYCDGLSLSYQDRTRIGYLDLYDKNQRLARWFFTIAHNKSARNVVEQFSFQLDYHLNDKKTHFDDDTLSLDLKVKPEATKTVAENEPRNTTKIQSLLRLWPFAKPYKFQLVCCFVLTLIATSAKLVPPYLTMPLMDNVLIPYQTGQLINTNLIAYYLSLLLFSVLLAWGLNWASTYIVALVSERIASDMRTKTYQHLLGLSQDYFAEKRTGDLMSRIGSESDTISVFLSLHLLDFATDVLMLFMIVPILISMDPWLALVTLLPLPFIVWMILFIRVRLSIRYEKIYRVWAEVTNVLADTIPGIRVVKAFGQESREATRFKTANIRNLIENDKLNKLWALFSPTVALMTELGLLLVWAFGIWQVAHGIIQVGVLMAFVSYLSRFYGRIESMTKITSIAEQSASASRRIFAILDHKATVAEPQNPVHIGQVKGLIEIKNMTFHYGQDEVYRGLNLTIKPGEMIGIVGRSGAGKSTLINLICRLHDVSQGSISLDGTDIRLFPIAEYRSKIGLVSQEPYLFFGTIAENLSYGKPNATRAEIIKAARAAYAHEFIMRLPHGYDSLIGERGQRLSVGQCQRITIARALLIDPPILIFDEATSSLDSQTEHEIQKGLNNLVHGRTTIAIAHRLSTLRHADRIIVLDEGQIIEEGNHLALMAKKGSYYSAYNVQLNHSADDSHDDHEG